MDLSIITPCFNHGIYLDEMMESVHNNNWLFNYEHIIINDGSTDEYTIEKLKTISKKYNVTIVNKNNTGLSATRNLGLNLAKGKFILPLDADNKICEKTFEKCVQVMRNNPQIFVVYTDAEFFGERAGLWKVGKLDMIEMLKYNKIDACALIRKDAFFDLGNYDENMKLGNEDWELWLRFLFNEKEFYYLEEIGFYYRVASNSMSAKDTRPKYHEIRNYIINKHSDNFRKYALISIDKYVELKSEINYIKNTWEKNRFKSIVKLLLGKKVFS